ncbi:MAG: IS1 family transposase [Magnetococcus sp. DMHC-6]
MICPNCESNNFVKNGFTLGGKQNHKCQDCGRQFVQDPRPFNRIPQSTIDLIEDLLLEKIPLAGIARVTKVSERWLQYYVNEKYGAVPRELNVVSKKKGRLTLECDEMWSFVDNKGNKQWIWLAIDRNTREIVGYHIGKRDRDAAEALWKSLPPVYRQCAVCYTDFWAVYALVFPCQRHKAVGKETGHTNRMERFNNTLRQRVSRLVRSTLSFSKKSENHIGAILLFIHHYNASLEIA